jgi:benzoyl-CoA reductase subunit C
MSMAKERRSIEALVETCRDLHEDVDLTAVRRWKEGGKNRVAVGYLPIYIPSEILHAVGVLPVGIIGGGDRTDIIRGDAYFQSYICHLPRSVVELGVSGRLDFCDGFLFPSTCDVIRNLSGVWQVLFPEIWAHYFDIPQDFDPERGGRWLRHELDVIRAGLERLRGTPVTDDEIRAAIRLHDENRRLLGRLYEVRSRLPWKALTTEVYLVQRAGLVLPVDEHNALMREYLDAVEDTDRPLRDHSRVVLSGAFCEQPPLGLLATLERAGCYIVDDDLLLGPRFLTGPVPDDGGGDPLEALVRGFLEERSEAAFVYIDDEEKGAALANMVRTREAEGVIFCAPSFCDPALLDRPMLVRALDRRGVSHIGFKYSENTGQFQTIREQAGTFADSLKLWT